MTPNSYSTMLQSQHTNVNITRNIGANSSQLPGQCRHVDQRTGSQGQKNPKGGKW